MSALLTLVAGVLGAVPERLRGPACALAAGLARCLWPGRAWVASENLAAAWPSGAPVRPGHVFGHLAGVAWDFVRLPRHRRRGFEDVRIEGLSTVRAALAEGRGVLAVTGHLGSWELVAAAVARLVPAPVHLVVKSLGPLDDWVDARRRGAGCRTIAAREGPATARAILRALSAGHLVVMLIDQHAPTARGRGAVTVPFFGRPASTTTLPARLALRRGVPLLSVVAWRSARGAHRVVVEAVPTAGRQVVGLTAALTRRVEAAIRAHPSQWLWTHRRWKVSTPGGGPGVGGC